MLTIKNYRKLEDKYNIKSVIEEEDRYIIQYDKGFLYDKGMDRSDKIKWEVIIYLSRIDKNNFYRLELIDSDNAEQKVKMIQMNQIQNIEAFYHMLEAQCWLLCDNG